MRVSSCLAAATTCAFLIPCRAVPAAVLWDNNLTPDRVAAVPLTVAGSRLVDDFFLHAPSEITGFRLTVVEDPGFSPGDLFEVFVYTEAGGAPGELVAQETTTLTRQATGGSFFGRAEFVYEVSGIAIRLEPGSYWIGGRNVRASGTGLNYWMTSDGGPDGGGSAPSMRGLDEHWVPTGYQQAFVLNGSAVPEAGTGAAWLVALAGLFLTKRRLAP